jgi:hypothetical protein
VTSVAELSRSGRSRLALDPIVRGGSVGRAMVGRGVEDPIHDRRATLDHGPDLMSVDEFRDACAAVPHEPGHVFDRHARV